MQRRIDVNPAECVLYPKDWNKLMCFLAAEGHRLLAINEEINAVLKKKPVTDTPKVDSPKALDDKLASMSNDPYIKARNEILKGMDDFHRKEIERMEKTGDVNNRWYDEFTKQVRILADWKYPDKPSTN